MTRLRWICASACLVSLAGAGPVSATAAAKLPSRAKVASVPSPARLVLLAGRRKVPVRLAGVALPVPGGCAATASAAAARKLLVGRTVRVVGGTADAARLTLKGRDVSVSVLSRGLAGATAKAPKAARSAAAASKRKHLGIFGCASAPGAPGGTGSGATTPKQPAAPSTPVPATPAAATSTPAAAPAGPQPGDLSDDIAPDPGIPAPVVAVDSPAPAAGAYAIGPVSVQDVWVDPVGGSDGGDGSRALPLRTLTAAWAEVPEGADLVHGYRIRILPGTIAAEDAPNYWEDRRGSATAPVIVQSESGPASIDLPPINAANLRYAYFLGIRVDSAFDPFHCELCDHLLIRDSVLRGRTRGSGEVHETLKVNQSTSVFVETSTITGADDNAVDFVAVQRGHLLRNRIGDAEDWCAYAKGGSAGILVQGNHFDDCGTGGFTAGQGTGLQFMQAPFLHYEASEIAVLDNLVTRVDGSGLGVNGGFRILLAHNTIYRAGTRGQALEARLGSRSCDGQPGDDGRERCQAHLDAGGWGTTRVDDGTNFARIPSRHVTFADNLVLNPDSLTGADEVVAVEGPYSGPAQAGSGLRTVSADDDLRFVGNVVWYGRSDLPSGVADDAAFRAANAVNVERPRLVDPEGGDFRPAAGYAPAGAAVPAFGAWDGPAGEPQLGVPVDLTRTYDGRARSGHTPGAF